MADFLGKTDMLSFLAIIGFTAVFFLIQSYGNLAYGLAGQFGMTVVFIIIMCISLVVLLHETKDERYYNPLTKIRLGVAGVAVLAMVMITSVCAYLFSGASPEQTIVSMKTLSMTQATPSSVATNFLSEVTFQFGLVATAEEFLKLMGYVVLKNRKWHNQTVGTIIAVGLPVGLWAIYHGIQSYDNPLMIIPAFLNGLLLIGVLEITKSYIVCVIAHGGYNSISILINYIRSTATVPFFPTTWTFTDVIIIILTAVWVGFLILPIFKRKETMTY